MIVYVTSVGWRALQYLARVLTSGLAALAHSTQWLPTFACTRHSVQAHRPQRVQRRPASRRGCRKHIPGWFVSTLAWPGGGGGRVDMAGARVFSPRPRRRGTGRTSRPGVVRSPRCSYSRSHGMGFRDRTRVPGEARLDGVVRQGRDHPARDARRGMAQPGGSGDVSSDHRPAQGRGPQAGVVGRPPAARHGRPRLRPGEARADARDPRAVRVRPGDLRQPGARFRQRRTDRGRRHRGSEGALDAAAPRRQDALLLLDDRADGRRRSDAVEDDRDP